MKMKRISYVLVMALVVIAFGTIGCSGGGGDNPPPPPPSDNTGGTGGTGDTGGTTGDTGGTGGTTVGTSAASPMVVTSKVTVVDAKLSGTVAAAKPLFLGALKLAPAAGTDYDKDKTEVFVHERSVEGFNIINEILCSVAQTKYDSMMNKGPYKALVDTNQCSSDRGDASAAGQKSSNKSSGSEAPDYETWTVDVTRADGESPQYVKFWIHTEDGPEDKPVMIFGLLTITEGVSETYPYGLFTINFEEYPVTPSGAVDTNTSVLKGFLNAEKESSTGKILLKFAMEGAGPGWSMTQMVTLDRAADGASGGGTVAVSQSFGQFSESANFNVAFDQANFLRGDYPGNNNKVCLDRDNFDETVWRYSLYDEAGARVIKNSGFPIKYNDGERDYFGWVGYWDLWLPEEVTINDGATIYKQTYGPDGGTETAYTLLKRGGKLKKHDRKLLALADVKNIPLDYWDNGTNYQVAWKNGAFVYLAKQNQTNWTWDQCTVQTCPASIDLTTLQWDQLNFWSESLGGSIQVKLNCPPAQDTMWPPVCNSSSASNTSPVILYVEDIVYPGDLGTQTLTLSCYDDMSCPDPAALATSNPFFASQITIPAANITLGGGTGDWTGIAPLATDSATDSTGDKTGDDITAIYAAKDNANLYIRLDLSENANTTFGNGPSDTGNIDGNYRFQIESDSGSYPFLEIGVAHNNGEWQVGGNGSSGNAPSSLSDDGSGNGNPDLVRVSGNVIELAIPQNDIGNPTVIRRISAEANSCCGDDWNNSIWAWDISEVIVKHDYTFDPTASGMVLKSGGSDVVLTTPSANPENQWGLNSAPLFNPTAANLALLACDWDPNRLCPWRAWSELPVYYTWETGPNSWNQLTLLKDGNNNALKFDPPLRVDYVHSQSDANAPDYKYNGAKFFLEYAGFGELHGIPGKCVDMDTGQDINCGEGGPGTRWVPEFSIPTGATVAAGTSSTYYVKQLEKEQRMKGVDVAACSSSLSLTNYPLPSVGFGWQKPDIGQEPALTVAPAVIGGVVQ